MQLSLPEFSRLFQIFRYLGVFSDYTKILEKKEESTGEKNPVEMEPETTDFCPLSVLIACLEQCSDWPCFSAQVAEQPQYVRG